MNPIAQLILAVLPEVVGEIKRRHAAANPDAPALTSAEVLTTFEMVFKGSDTRDDFLRAELKAEIAAAAARATEALSFQIA